MFAQSKGGYVSDIELHNIYQNMLFYNRCMLSDASKGTKTVYEIKEK